MLEATSGSITGFVEPSTLERTWFTLTPFEEDVGGLSGFVSFSESRWDGAEASAGTG